MKKVIDQEISRRKLFKFAVGTLAAGQAVAKACGIQTGAQPLGPFFPNEGTPLDVIREDANQMTPLHLANDNDLTFVMGRTGTASGQKVMIRGKVTDESCKPINAATVVIWQASHSGRYNHKGDSENFDFIHPKTGLQIKRTLDPFFQSWGQTRTDQNGNYLFKTIVPGFYPADLKSEWFRPPHIHFMVWAPVFPQLVTQMYFKSEQFADNHWIQELNQKDPLLQSEKISQTQRNQLIVEFKGSSKHLVGNFDIMLAK